MINLSCIFCPYDHEDVIMIHISEYTKSKISCQGPPRCKYYVIELG